MYAWRTQQKSNCTIVELVQCYDFLSKRTENKEPIADRTKSDWSNEESKAS